MKLRRRAFTLIELLVVIAITAILMTVIIVPIVQSFNLTRAAQAWADAQDKARTLTERIAHEINNARQVRDNTGDRGRLDIVVTSPTGGGPIAGYDPAFNWFRVSIFNAKIDLINPAEGDPNNMRNGAFVNLQGVADPTLKVPMGQVNLPSTPGLSLTRYFIGLRNPLRRNAANTAYAGYVEPFSGILQTRGTGGGRDNLYVLYRAGVNPMIWSNNQQKFVVNKAFFFDQDRDNDPNTHGPLLDDPTFFDPTVNYPAYSIPDPDGIPEPTKAQMVQNWLRVSAIQTEVSRFDMIQPLYDKFTHQPVITAAGPTLITLIQFRPTRVSDEPAEGQEDQRLGVESDSAGRTASDVFLTKYAGWSNAVMSWFPGGYVSPGAYEVGLPTQDGKGYNVWDWNPVNDGPSLLPNSVPTGYMLLDDAIYRASLQNGIRASLTRAMASANDFDISSGRGNWLNDGAKRSSFVGFVGEPDRGRARLSYNINELGVVGGAPDYVPVALPDLLNNPNNLPSGETWTGPGPALSPQNDPNVTTGTFSDAAYSSINKKFNKLWNDFPTLRGDLHRFLDLRVTPNSDGAPSPLDPDPLRGFGRAYIVPGSVVIYGPDQNPGPNNGRRVQYWSTTREPGPNQFRINYTDIPEPDYTLLGLTPPPPTYTPTDFMSAVYQPRYKAGYIQFNSDPNVPLAADDPATAENEGLILVFYRFQFSRPNDSMMVNYDSRQLMSVQLTIRNYPQSSVPNPQTVTLQSMATVRNFLR